MINAIITDFDGTLVDTFDANLRAYQKAFSEVGLNLTADKYRECFGYRFERFMMAMAVTDERTWNYIREAKKDYYPLYFDYLKPNYALISLIEGFHKKGGKTAIASTARKENLMNVVRHIGVEEIFDLIYAGVDVKQGKPSPEIYEKAMNVLGVTPTEALIFEDSEVGIQAAKASGANYMIISKEQFL